MKQPRRTLKAETLKALSSLFTSEPPPERWADVKAFWGDWFDPRLVILVRSYDYHRRVAESDFAELRRIQSGELDLVDHHLETFQEKSAVFREAADAAAVCSDREFFQQVAAIMEAVERGEEPSDERAQNFLNTYWMLRLPDRDKNPDGAFNPAPTLAAIVERVDDLNGWGIGPPPKDKRRTVRDFLDVRGMPYSNENFKKGRPSA